MSNNPCCKGCGAPDPEPFFEVPQVPANVGSIASTISDSQNAACGAVRLVACSRCGLIWNQLFDGNVVGFGPGYEVSLKHSEVFRQYIRNVCDRLITRHDLRGKHILEIGCGAGDFLRMICTAGANYGVGIDPTVPHPTVESAGEGQVRFIRDYYSSVHAEHIGDIVCCLSVFEDIPQPLEFLQDLRNSIGDRPVSLYFEVFNGYRSIRQREVWSIHYEQCNYFSIDALVGLFERAGFDILDAGPCYQGDQYLFVEARPGAQGAASSPEKARINGEREFQSTIRDFGKEYINQCKLWQQRLRQWQVSGQRVVVWGSGGKGISFLTAIPNATHVDYVVDVNPNRQGHYIPLSGHQIFGPSRLKELPPNIVILTNALYRMEIEAQLDELGIECETFVA